jgi:hypothetical protein
MTDIRDHRPACHHIVSTASCPSGRLITCRSLPRAAAAVRLCGRPSRLGCRVRRLGLARYPGYRCGGEFAHLPGVLRTDLEPASDRP